MSLLRAVALTTASLVVARVVVVIAGIGAVGLASRHLGPAGYGALTAAMAYAATFAVLTDLGLATVAVREISRDPSRERTIVGTVISVGALCAVAAAALAVGLMFLVYAGDDDHDIRVAIAILLVQLAAAPLVGATRAYFTARQRGWVLAAGEVALAVVMVAATAAVVAAGGGFVAVVCAVAAGYVGQGLVMTVLLLRDRGFAFGWHPATARTLLRLALPLAGTLIINYLYFRLDVLLLSWLKSEADVGVYGLAYRVIEALMVLPGYVMLALFPEIARSGEDRARVAGIVGSALGVMELIALPVVVLTAVLAEPIVTLIGTEEYAGAASVLRLLMLAVGVSYLNGVFGNALVALGRQAQLLRVSLAVLALNIALNLVLIPKYGVDGAAIAVVVSEVLAFFLVRRMLVGAAQQPASAPHARILAASAGLLPGVALALLADDSFGDLPLVLLAGAVGMSGYAVAALLFGAVPEPLRAPLARLRR